MAEPEWHFLGALHSFGIPAPARRPLGTSLVYCFASQFGFLPSSIPGKSLYVTAALSG